MAAFGDLGKFLGLGSTGDVAAVYLVLRLHNKNQLDGEVTKQQTCLVNLAVTALTLPRHQLKQVSIVRLQF